MFLSIFNILNIKYPRIYMQLTDELFYQELAEAVSTIIYRNDSDALNNYSLQIRKETNIDILPLWTGIWRTHLNKVGVTLYKSNSCELR